VGLAVGPIPEATSVGRTFHGVSVMCVGEMMKRQQLRTLLDFVVPGFQDKLCISAYREKIRNGRFNHLLLKSVLLREVLNSARDLANELKV